MRSAANTLLGNAQLPPGTQRDVLIDPLIDGVTGVQSNATQAIGAQLVRLIGQQHPRFSVKPFNAANLASGPLVLIGTLTGVNSERKAEGRREAYRIWLTLADMRTGRIVGKGTAFALSQGVDTTPLPLFADAPALSEDEATNGYINTCHGTKVGDPIHPRYVDHIIVATTIAEGADAYAAGQYRDALELFQTALASPGGNQLRVHSGLYLANLRLGRSAAAAQAFGSIVEQGLDGKRLSVKVLFRPGTSTLWSLPGPTAPPHAMWMREIATRAATRDSCLDVVGHTSFTGAEPVNERLSLMRAEVVKKELQRRAPKLGPRLRSAGMASRQMLIGNGRDDLSDALDRRVEFIVRGC